MKGAEGSMAVVIALAMVAFLGMASLAVDMGHLYTVKNEMQNNADAAALAAARALIHEDMSTDNRDTYRDASGAVNAAMAVLQQASTLQGLASMPDGSRNDVDITFGTWNEHAIGSKWTNIGNSTAVPPSSTANAVQVTLRRAAGTAYGPVTNFFAGVFGSGTSEVAATSRACMGYAYSVYAGTVELPVALPATGPISPLASAGNSSWWAGIFGPSEAVATTTKTIVFKDSGGYYVPGSTPTNVNTGVTSANPLDPRQVYLFTVGQSDPVPGTLTDILEKIYTPNKTGSILHVDKLALGTQIYARSEFRYGIQYIGPIFQRLQKAYNYKTTGNANTAPPAGTPWRVTMPVYGSTHNPLVTQGYKNGFMSLARLLAPWPSEVYACYTMPPPTIFVNGFVNADIVGVTYTSSCDDCSYTFPKKITSPAPISGSTTYQNKLDCLARLSSSVWNANSMTVKNVTSVSTIIPGIPNVAGEAGGLSAKEMNSAATTNVGAFASVPKLIPAN
jgi:Flp pilus assembly protein TadG